MKASQYIQDYCSKHGANGQDWKVFVSQISPNDAFNFNIIPISFREFDTKYIAYTGRIGLISAPRWKIAKHFLLSQDCQWRYGTERLLWVYEDKTKEELFNECELTLANMENCQFDWLWLCDFNMFRVASGMMMISNRKIVSDLFGCNSRKIENYDPYARPQGFVNKGNDWYKILEYIGNIEL